MSETTKRDRIGQTFRYAEQALYLAVAVALLGLTIYLVRHTSRPEPLPAHERGARDEEAVGTADSHAPPG
jgi:hypothetical protein